MIQRTVLARGIGALMALGLAATVAAQGPVAKRLTSDSCPGTGCIVIPTEKMGAVAIQIVGTMNGTISFTGSTDGRTFTELKLSKVDGSGTASSATAAGHFFGNVGGLRYVRAAFTTYNSGTPMVTLSVSPAGGGGGAGSASSGGTVDQGTASATEQWLVNCVTGCTAASSADDDGSIPAASTNSNANALLNVYNGSAWARLTFGQGTMSASLPVAIASNQTAVPASQSGTWTVQPGNTANTTAWLVTGTGGTFPATQSGTWNIGTVTAVTAISNALPAGTNAIGKLAANSGVDIGDVDVTSLPALVAGTAVIGKVRLVESAGDEVTDATANAVKVMVVDSAGAAVSPGVLDPCTGNAKTTDPFSLTARGVIVAKTSAKKTYICAIAIVAGAAEIFNLVEGDGTTCQSNTAVLVGSSTAANGLSFAANGGMTIGNGAAAIINGKTTNLDVCIVPSSTNRLSGFVTWAQQ